MDVFWMDLRTNSDDLPTRHELIILHNWERACLLCGTKLMCK